MVSDDAERDDEDGNQQIEEDLARNRNAVPGVWGRRNLRCGRLMLQRWIPAMSSACCRTRSAKGASRWMSPCSIACSASLWICSALVSSGHAGADAHGIASASRHRTAARFTHHRNYPKSPNHRRLSIQPLTCLGLKTPQDIGPSMPGGIRPSVDRVANRAAIVVNARFKAVSDTALLPPRRSSGNAPVTMRGGDPGVRPRCATRRARGRDPGPRMSGCIPRGAAPRHTPCVSQPRHVRARATAGSASSA